MYFKAQVNDDELYIDAKDLDEAKHHLERMLTAQNKTIPYELVEWTELTDLPEGKIPLTFESVSKSGKDKTGPDLFS